MKRFVFKLFPFVLVLLVTAPALFAHADELKPINQINQKMIQNRFGDPGW